MNKRKVRESDREKEQGIAGVVSQEWWFQKTRGEYLKEEELPPRRGCGVSQVWTSFKLFGAGVLEKSKSEHFVRGLGRVCALASFVVPNP